MTKQLYAVRARVAVRLVQGKDSIPGEPGAVTKAAFAGGCWRYEVHLDKHVKPSSTYLESQLMPGQPKR